MSKATLKEHQKALLSLLTELDRVCRRHDIKYMLFAGTLLGAVRHGGFIPWDDDADVIMLRSDYDKFMSIAPSELEPEKFFLQREFSEHWPMFFSKLRLNGTACIERYHPKDLESHRGVYIDIFPCDNLSDIGFKRKLQYYASKIVIAKGLFKRGYLTDSTAKKLFMTACRVLPCKPFWKFTINRKQNSTRMLHSFFGASQRYEKNIYERAWLESVAELSFEGKSFFVPTEYDKILTHLYGDYMTPLPESERGAKVHAEIVDLESSYEKYNDIHKTLQFDEYTRSIR
ncbi:MAG: LicD family protein [Clostridia bacterium]|nr:LicD family protein [Clostridia bacterium]